MRRAFLWFLGAVLVVAVLCVALFQLPAVQDRVLERAVARIMAASPDALFEEDALRVLLCGSSSPLPHRDRAQACVAVFAAGRMWIVDTGAGSWNNLALLHLMRYYASGEETNTTALARAASRRSPRST